MEDGNYQPTSIGNWFVTMIIISIPIVNIIALFWWAFSGATPISKSNFAKATLIWFGIVIVLSMLFFGAALTGM